MATPNFARTERAALCDLLDEVGPDRPTLCAGWTTRDLAAHLVVRDRRPDAAAGIMLPFLAGHGDRVRDAAAKRDFATLVDQARHPPRFGLAGIGPLDRATNTTEFFIHHEDVRRANGRDPRPEMADLEALAWRMTGYSARRLAGAIRPYGLELVNPDGARKARGSGEVAVLTGPASELILYLGGRRATAHVTLSGTADAVAAVERSTITI